MTETKKSTKPTKPEPSVFPAREIILEILLEVTAGREYSHIMIRNVLEKYNYIRTEEKAFIKRVSEGTLERMIQIDYVINQYSTVKIEKMKPVIRNILRMATFQILFMNGVPDSAACNEAVKLAQRKKFQQLKGFVNGVLRTISRQKEEIKYPDPEKNRLLYYSIIYSMPEWILQMWEKQYSTDVVEKMCRALLEEHKVTIRVNESLSEEETKVLLDEIKAAGVECKRHEYLPYAYILEHTEGAFAIPGFVDGRITIQDVSSMLAVEVAKIEPGMQIIDVCAAPGGKAVHAASKLGGNGHVEARDLSERKVEMIQQNIDRMKQTQIDAVIADACSLDQGKIETADVVIADLPCSGLGVIGKKRDIKYHIQQSSLQAITLLQKEILTVVQNYVKPGGTLLYSTCTIHKGENEEIVDWFLEQFSYRLDPISPFLPDQLRSAQTDKGYLQLLPGIHAADGFFMARFVKIATEKDKEK